MAPERGVTSITAPDIWQRLGLRSHWAERAFLVVFVLVIRAPGFHHSVVADWDESMYALMAREVLHGGLPYVTIFQEKPLGPTMLVAAAMKLFGESIWSLRLLGSLCVAATTLILRELALAGSLSRLAAAGGALLYAAYSIELGGMATNTEIQFAPFTAAAVLVALKSQDSIQPAEQSRAILLAGLLIGMGIWFKYIAAFPGCVLFVALVGHWLLRRRVNLAHVIWLAVIYFLACLLPTMLTALVYIWIGAWDAFWYSNIGFMPIYKALPRPAIDIETTLILVLLATYPLLALSFIGFVCWRDRPRLTAIVLGWSIAETIALAVPWKFWDHYFLLLMPPLCLSAAIGFDGLARRLPPGKLWMGVANIPAFAVIFFAVAAAGWEFPRLQARFSKPDPARQVADFLRKDPAATVWVINHEPIIYFLAGLAAPTIYVFPAHLVGAYSILARTEPEVEIRRVLANRPRYLVLDPVDRHIILPHLDQMITAAITANYELAFSTPGRVDNILVYRRRDQDG